MTSTNTPLPLCVRCKGGPSISTVANGDAYEAVCMACLLAPIAEHQKAQRIQAEFEAWKRDHLNHEADDLRAERDAYKKAKEENDERFMRERDEARAEAEQLRSDKQKLLDVLGSIAYDKRAVAERQKAAMIAAINDDGYASYDGAEVVSILKAVPLVVEDDE